jgi:hypothetical protein
VKFRERLQALAQWTLYRVTGSAIELESESFTELSSRAVFPVDETLMQRIAERRAAMPDNQIKALSPYKPPKRIEEQPDIPQAPLPIPDDFCV